MKSILGMLPAGGPGTIRYKMHLHAEDFVGAAFDTREDAVDSVTGKSTRHGGPSESRLELPVVRGAGQTRDHPPSRERQVEKEFFMAS